MSKIRQLSKDVAERIAAGEVVERPSSIVKELVENSIDANASFISVSIEDGGKASITVTDDGAGMDAEDVGLCVMRHATSKIRIESDLWNINTMGFRGEALAAIGSVAKLTIESKPNNKDTLEGIRVDVDGGAIGRPQIIGMASGTRVIVKYLFFNVPARQKFLKSASVEYGHIADAVTSFALAYPKIRFELISDGKKRLAFNDASTIDRVREVLKVDDGKNLIKVEEGGDLVSVSGFISHMSSASPKGFYTFLNRRIVRDKLLIHAVTSAYSGRLERGEYPIAALWIDVDPSKVDVNVHPQKREVRFVNGGAIHDFVCMALKKALGSHNPVTVVSSEFNAEKNDPKPFESPRNYNWLSGGDRIASSSEAKAAISNLRVPILDIDQRIIGDAHECSASLNPVGQLGLTYIVCESRDGDMVIIDQHAAHERLGFERLKRQYLANGVVRQVLLLPERIELGEKGLAYIMSHKGVIEEAGFEIEDFGGGSLLVKCVPDIVGSISVKTIFEKIAVDLEEYERSNTFQNTTEAIFAIVACHAMVRSGDRLSMSEMARLIQDIEREDIKTCPHGRPVLVKIGKAEIEKWFGRR